eukprot:1159070-Pelagomonas_calceolata.AAC.3
MLHIVGVFLDCAVAHISQQWRAAVQLAFLSMLKHPILAYLTHACRLKGRGMPYVPWLTLTECHELKFSNMYSGILGTEPAKGSRKASSEDLVALLFASLMLMFCLVNVLARFA